MNDAIRGGLAVVLLALVAVAVGYGADYAAARGLGFAALMLGVVIVAIGLIQKPSQD